jgi:hypothetical protein
MFPARTARVGIVTRIAATLVALVAGAFAAATSAAATSPPIAVAPSGCALQCITKALVTTTATLATVEIETRVPAKVVVTARRLSNTGGLVAGPPDASVPGFLFLKSRTVFLRELEPKTTYRIVVSATDTAGRTESRTGTFETRPVETTLEPPAGGYSSGVGCSQKCITKAVPVAVGPTAATFQIATNTSAKITVIVSRNGSIASIVTSAYTKSFTHAASPLYPGTTYDLFVRATDANGHTEHHHFTFKTVERKARVTLWKIKVLGDGDSGSVSGELAFNYWLDKKTAGGTGFHKRSSGDSFYVNAEGTTRPGLTRVIPVNGPNPQLDIRVHALECDGHVFMKNCAQEARPAGWVPSGGGDCGDDDCATAGGPFALNSLLAHGALPGNYGTSLPAGHDAYLVFETTQYHVKFRVYAYVDFFFDH